LPLGILKHREAVTHQQRLRVETGNTPNPSAAGQEQPFVNTAYTAVKRLVADVKG
jgi:hypothetical protein